MTKMSLSFPVIFITTSTMVLWVDSTVAFVGVTEISSTPPRCSFWTSSSFRTSRTTATTTRLLDTEEPIFPIDSARNLLTQDPQILQSSECQGLSEPLLPIRGHVIETTLIPFNGGVSASDFVSDQAMYVFPLVVTPKRYCVRFCLRAFLKANQDWVDTKILEYGAVLFRGFDITSAAEVEAGIRALERNATANTLNKDYRGTSPRIAQPGSEYVFSAAEVPSHFPIAQHLEMSFLPSPPNRLFFSALQAPTGKVGGATAMTNFGKVYRDMPKSILQKMASKKLKYRRTHYKKGASPLFTNDVAALKSWTEVFGTTNKTEIEEICRREGTPMRWTGRNNDTFVSEYESDAIQLHPKRDNQYGSITHKYFIGRPFRRNCGLPSLDHVISGLQCVVSPIGSSVSSPPWCSANEWHLL